MKLICSPLVIPLLSLAAPDAQITSVSPRHRVKETTKPANMLKAANSDSDGQRKIIREVAAENYQLVVA